MFKKLSNKTLIIVFAVLLVIAALIIFKNNSGEERTFRSSLVDIDSSAVSQINIFSKSKSGKEKIKLFKDDDGIWKVELGKDKSAPVADGKINNIFSAVMKIKPDRLVANDEAKWKDFGVDTTATRVEFYEGGDKTLDLVIGRFRFQQPRSMNTYVRLADDVDVYEVEGYLGMTFSKKANDYRNIKIISADMKNWTNVAFSYPADSSYQLTKVDDKWIVTGGMQIDSATTIKKLNIMSNITATEFVDDVDAGALGKPEMTLEITRNDGDPIKVEAFKTADDKYIIHSSQNTEAYFDGEKGDLFKRVFAELNAFQKKPKKK